MLNKQSILDNLPIIEGENTIRSWERNDLDLLSQWSSYPFPYESFNYRFREMTPTERDQHFQHRESNANRVTFILDHDEQKAIGYLALVEIEWENRKVGNMAFRISPNLCNKGTGTWFMRKVSEFCFQLGFITLRLDVAASNQRAVRCYEKSGYNITGEFWQDDIKLNEYDLKQPTFDFLRPHVRSEKSIPQLRFYWMESKRA